MDPCQRKTSTIPRSPGSGPINWAPVGTISETSDKFPLRLRHDLGSLGAHWIVFGLISSAMASLSEPSQNEPLAPPSPGRVTIDLRQGAYASSVARADVERALRRVAIATEALTFTLLPEYLALSLEVVRAARERSMTSAFSGSASSDLRLRCRRSSPCGRSRSNFGLNRQRGTQGDGA
jgi:hypothetical protein